MASYKAKHGLTSTPVDTILTTSSMPPPKSSFANAGTRYHHVVSSPNSIISFNKSPRRGLMKSPNNRRSIPYHKRTSTFASPQQHSTPDSESMNAASALTALFHSPNVKPSPTPPANSHSRNTQTQADEADAQLMLFLATSPSPAKASPKHRPGHSNQWHNGNLDASPRYSNVDFTQWIHSPRELPRVRKE